MVDLIERLRNAVSYRINGPDAGHAAALFHEASESLATERERAEKAEDLLGIYERERERWIESADARIDAAESFLAEAKRLLKPFAALDAPSNPKWDCGTFLIMHVDIAAASRFLAQEEDRG